VTQQETIRLDDEPDVVAELGRGLHDVCAERHRGTQQDSQHLRRRIQVKIPHSASLADFL